jgi:hypothetical protein
MLQRGRLLRAAVRPAVDLARLQPLLDRVGLASWPTHAVPTRDGAGAAQLDATACLAPLFAHGFVFEEHQYASLGDAVVAAEIAEAVFAFCTHRRLAVTPNVTRQLAACLQNHYAMRFHAEALGLPDLAASAAAAVDARDPAAVLAALTVPAVGPRRVDLQGTSFEFAPHAFAPSVLGARLSHFIGCVHVFVGPEAAGHVVRNIWGLQGGDGDAAVNVPHRAVALLARLVEAYPSNAVALAVLAAQGVSATFTARTIMAPLDLAPPAPGVGGGVGGGSGAAYGGGAASAAAGDALHDARSRLHFEATGAAESGGSALAVNGDAGQLDAAAAAGGVQRGTVSAEQAAVSLAAGPGLVDVLARWERSTAAVDTATAMGSGWLQPGEGEAPYARHAAANSPTTGRFIADAIGVAEPLQGARVADFRFQREVADPSFHAADAGKDGIAVETGGLPVAEYVRGFSQPHVRKFEVTMAAAGGVEDGGKVLGRAVAGRYTAARTAAAQRYLEGVLRDMSTMVTKSAQQQ